MDELDDGEINKHEQVLNGAGGLQRALGATILGK